MEDNTVAFEKPKPEIVPFDFGIPIDATTLYDIYAVKHIQDLRDKYKPKLAKPLLMALMALAKFDSPESRGARLAIAVELGWEPPKNKRERFELDLEQRNEVGGIIDSSKLAGSDPRRMMDMVDAFWKKTAEKMGFNAGSQRQIPGEPPHIFSAEINQQI